MFSLETVRRDKVPRRHTTAWGSPQGVFASVDELVAAPLHNGLVTWTTDVAPVDLLIEDNQAATTIVSLHAAMGQKPMDLPIFTGRSVTEGLPVNRIFVSDASLCLDADLKLAWYLGAEGLRSHAALARGDRYAAGSGWVPVTLSSSGCPGEVLQRSTSLTPLAIHWPCPSTHRPGSRTTTSRRGRPTWLRASERRVRREESLAALDANPRADLVGLRCGVREPRHHCKLARRACHHTAYDVASGAPTPRQCSPASPGVGPRSRAAVGAGPANADARRVPGRRRLVRLRPTVGSGDRLG